MLGVLLDTLEVHKGMGAHGITYDSWGGTYVDGVGLACDKSPAIQPWPAQEANQTKDRVANEALAIYFLPNVWHRCS